MVCVKYLCFALVFGMIGIDDSAGSLSLGVCSLNCDRNEHSAQEALGIGRPGPPGKRGPVGPPGLPGRVGSRGAAGPPGSSCDCSLYGRLEHRIEQLEDMVEKLNGQSFPSDCIDFKESVIDSGTAIIFPFSETSMGLHVYCNQAIEEGGWICFHYILLHNQKVIQRRVDGSEDFFRGWDDYVNGFGDKQREFWLGLEAIHRITNTTPYELRIDLEAFDGVTGFAKYSTFSVADSSDFYRLSVTGYTGNAGDAMAHHNGQQFSTKQGDRDRSPIEHCADKYTGAWWYNYCHHTNLNGVYNGDGAKGVTWYALKNKQESLKRVEMKIRKRS